MPGTLAADLRRGRAGQSTGLRGCGGLGAQRPHGSPVLLIGTPRPNQKNVLAVANRVNGAYKASVEDAVVGGAAVQKAVRDPNCLAVEANSSR